MEISSEQLPNCYFQPNWDNSNDQNDPFESALSSMISSPTATSNGGGMILGDGMIRELIGRLGSISDSGEISLNSTNNSCYSTPLNSPPKFNLSSLMMMGQNGNFPNNPPNLAPFNVDPGFVERAAKFSCFGNNSFVGGELGMNNNRSVPKLESGKLSRVSSNQSIRVGGGVNLQIDVNSGCYEKKFGGISRASTPENGDFGDSREESSVSEQNTGGEMGLKTQNDANSRKRKSIPKAKLKESPKVDAEKEESNAKRSKPEDEEEVAKTEPPKDYIHVRARRGQATDSHSLAERVRREKISERMKFLQDLVPGCNKVTGKATVLDEIINYVQSLQHQVEMFQSRGSAIPPTMYQLYQNSATSSPHGGLPNGIHNPFSLNQGIQLPPMQGFGDFMTQVPTFWENDLHPDGYCPESNRKFTWYITKYPNES